MMMVTNSQVMGAMDGVELNRASIVSKVHPIILIYVLKNAGIHDIGIMINVMTGIQSMGMAVTRTVSWKKVGFVKQIIHMIGLIIAMKYVEMQGLKDGTHAMMAM